MAIANKDLLLKIHGVFLFEGGGGCFLLKMVLNFTLEVTYLNLRFSQNFATRQHELDK